MVKLSFGGGNLKDPESLQTSLHEQLLDLEIDSEVQARHQSAAGRLRHLIRTLHRQTGQQVAVLVDEYDKPILDALDDPACARANRDYLRGFYGVIKDGDEHVRFALLTGVSKFSRVSLFSGLNNLRDITLNPDYSAICGYTDTDLDTVFAAELPGLDREQVRERYNGYSWGGERKVYNPFDVLLLFTEREFNAWWFETGTPTFLTRLLTERCVAADRLDGLRVSKALLSTFDVDSIAPEALLFQTGYLTVDGREWGDDGIEYFRLAYPNREVRQSLNLSLLNHITGDSRRREEHSQALQRLLQAGDLDGLETWFRALFAGIPYHWHSRNTIADYEGYYASVFYSFFVGSGATVTTEDSSSTGRADLVVQTRSRVYLFEFKVFASSQQGAAMRQLQERSYAAKYRHLGLPIHLVGVEFNAETRNVEVFESALA